MVSLEGGDASVVRGTAGYAIVPGMTVYGLLSVINAEGGNDDTSYGLGAEYQTEDYGIALQYKTFDDADLDILTLAGFYGFGASTVYGFATDLDYDSFDDDDTYYALGYKYDAAAFEVNVATAWYEGDFDTGLTAIGGEYNATQDFTVLASVVSTNEDYLDDGVLTIGGRYALNDSTSLEANYGTAFGDIDGDGFSLALTFETGARRLRVMDQVEDFASDTTPLLDITTPLFDILN
ncbi:porin [Celeribacter halophilus]|uniref:Porin n=1 Tax=Celeribacter halophilus TaxID=576117 RepID=A0AAW7XSF4_9RHOB|nr:porin [Celeribacter halophilus]MDO6455768.1 porin [Celeribacter halophilus]